MRSTTAIRSYSAITVAVFFSLVTCFVLMDDVRHGGEITVKHVMTLAVLAGTIYFGHRWWAEARQFRLGTTLGCTALFLAGTATCVLMSAGRNAEVTSHKALQANSVNTDRARALRDRDEAKRSYELAASGDDLSIREAKSAYDAAVTAAQVECQTGEGKACKAKRVTISESRKALEDAQANLRAIAHVRKDDLEAAESKVASQKPEQIANADIRAAAALFAKLPGISASVEQIEASLLVAFPFLQSLFCEIAAIVGFSIGLGHKTVEVKQKALPSPETVSNAEFRMVEPVPVSDSYDLHPEAMAVLEALRKARGRPVTNDELAAYMGVSKSEASKRVSALDGIVRRVRVGREVAISLL